MIGGPHHLRKEEEGGIRKNTKSVMTIPESSPHEGQKLKHDPSIFFSVAFIFTVLVLILLV